MTRDVDIETLRLLVSIAATDSIGAAARDRGISQPAASARLREFEARWQLEVVRRSPRGSRLTEDGLAVLAWARSVLHEADVMRAGLTALSAGRSNAAEQLVVAASLTIAEHILPRWIGLFHSHHPEVTPSLSVVNSETVSELVRNGEATIGFIETAVLPTDLSTRIVGTDQLIVVVRPDHPWALRSTPVSTATLVTSGWVLREAGSGTRSTFERALRAEPPVAMEVSSTRALIGAVSAGLGPAVVSARAVAVELERGHLRAVHHHLDLRRPLTAVWDPRRSLDSMSRRLIQVASSNTPG